MDEEKNKSGEDLTLESILAEYKSEAFIEGQQKTPKKSLDEQTKQILEETLGGSRNRAGLEEDDSLAGVGALMRQIHESVALEQSAHSQAVQEVVVSEEKPQTEEIIQASALEDTLSAGGFGVDKATSPKPRVIALEEMQGETKPTIMVPQVQIVPEVPETKGAVQIDPDRQAQRVARQKRFATRKSLEPGKVVQIPFSGRFGQEEQSSKSKDEGQVDELQNNLVAFAKQQEDVDFSFDQEEKEGFLAGLLGRFSKEKREESRGKRQEPTHQEEGQYDKEAFLEDGINLRRASGKYGKNVGAFQLRGAGTVLLGLIMLLFTALYDGGSNLPGVFGTSRGFAAVMLLLQILGMLLTSEVIARGILDIARKTPGVETLLTLAALAAAADALRVISAGGLGRGAPYAAVVVLALGCTLLGMKCICNAIKMTLRTGAMGKNPYVVQSKYYEKEECYALFKSRGDVEGFLRKTEQMDFSEHIYRLATPIFLAVSLVVSLVIAFFSTENVWAAFRYFSAFSLAGASFTGLFAYGLPYSMLAKKLSKIGAALAGWSAAVEVKSSAGLIVTDADVFPRGTLEISGVKVFKKSEEERIIASTCSLIVAARCGLSDVFADVLSKQKLSSLTVKDLICHEGGGIGATVGGEEVIVGTAGLMNLKGVRLPQNLNVKNAVFVVMHDELAAVFAINYVPLNSVKEALLSLFHTKTKPLFALRDFNISPMMLQNKFQINTNQVEFLTYEERYILSDLEADTRARPIAVLSREGLGPLVDVSVGGKRLYQTVIRNTIMAGFSSVLAFGFLASFFWLGASSAASSVNLVSYFSAWLLVMGLTSKSVTLD